MPSLKTYRLRIRSVQSTQKITKAMKMVAAAKLRRAQEQAMAARPYAEAMDSLMASLGASFKPGTGPKLLADTGSDKVHLVIVATGDRGLCGGYNANIIKRTEQRVAELKGQGYQVDLVLIGRKVVTYFQNRSSQYTIRASFTGLEQVPNAAEAGKISQEVLAEFLSGSTDRVEIIFTKFINLVSSKPVSQTLLPLDPQGIASPDDEIFRLTTRDGQLGVETGKVSNEQPALPSDMVFEQSPEQLLNALLPLYLPNQLLQIGRAHV